ncbi:MAG: Fe-S protein assembly chaperone HscA [Saprospiraceae bacterium]|nr:Fe-S protein assembly chaperone HscA [Saprospiraceae bacterium]
MAKITIDLKSGDVKKEVIPLIVGIDLGTTNSLVAYIKEGQPHLVSDADGKSVLMPSVVYFPDDQYSVVVGDEAKSFLVSHPERTIFSIKRLMGKSYGDLRDMQRHLSYEILDDDKGGLVKIRVGQHFYTPVELSARILSELKRRVEQSLGMPVDKAVVTVPAYFNDAQRQATRDAGRLAGLDVLRIVNEPTAASLAYGIGLESDTDKRIAVYDLGGGTFDISILHIQEGVFEVLSTNGDTFLGGDDIDQLIIDYWTDTFPIDNTSNAHGQSLRLLAEQAKKTLSCERSFYGTFNQTGVSLSREVLETMIVPLIERTLQCCQSALRDADLLPSQIDEVLLVGGATRIPFIKQKVSNFFGRMVHDELNPDEVVAVGAAIQADILAGNRRDLLLLDITPLSLGIETLGGLMDVIIPRNTKVPGSYARNYTTSVDGQKNLKISVFQGERDLVQHNRKLGEFILQGIPSMPAGIPKLEITFQLNADGILNVQAKELRSGVNQRIEVKPQYGISEEEMGRMLLDSIKFAKEDQHAKRVMEAKNEGQMLLLAASKFVEQNVDWLDGFQVEKIQHLVTALHQAIDSDDKDQIQAAIQTLNTFTTPLAHRAMEVHISSAMKGKKLT